MSGCNCRKKSCNQCCPKTIRGEQGKRGLKGDRGLQGPPGTLNMIGITETMEQAIVPSTPTIITGMTSPVVAGTYAVWFEGTAESLGVCVAVYGIYLDGVLQGYTRLYTGIAASIVAYRSSVACNNGAVVVAAPGTLTVQATVSSGTMTMYRGSLMLQKIS